MNVEPDVFLDMISLVTAYPLPKTLDRKTVLRTVKQLKDLLQEYLRTEPIYDNEENRYYIEVITQLMDQDLSFENKAALKVFVAKALKRFPDMPESTDKRIFSSIILPISCPEEKYLTQSYDKTKLRVMTLIGNKEVKTLAYKMKKINKTTDSITQKLLFEDYLISAKNMIDEIKEVGIVANNNINIEFIDMSDTGSILHALSVNELTRRVTIFKTGLQGINNMLGPKGFCLGESVLLGALPHNYKSGILMDMARWVVSYTEPPNFDDKIPVVLFITLENEGHKNLINWYRRTYAHLYGSVPENLNHNDIAEVVNAAYSKFGWKLHVIRKLGDYFGFEDYLKIVEDYKKQGMRVYVSIIDYPGLMKLGNGDISGSSERSKGLQTLFNKFANHSKHDNILFIAAHQLGPEAASIVNSGTIYPVKKFHGAYHFAESKAIFREVDCCILLNIEKNTNGQSFLTGAWAKHRDNIAPPIENQFFAYPFTEHGIMDDVNNPQPKSVKDIYNYRPEVNTVIDDESIFN